MRHVLLVFILAVASIPVWADHHEPRNFARYSPTFASSGQPTASQLESLVEQGVERVIYIAYSDHENSLESEDRLVSGLGASFVHIPVRWDAPRQQDYATFAAVMNAAPQQPTLLHCQSNYRASAFAMLYRVLEQGVPLADAKADMNAIWTPDETWTAFLKEMLEGAGVDPDCEGCDWTPWQPEH